LARSIRQLLDTTALLIERGVESDSLTENINTMTPIGKLTFHIFVALGEFERDILRQHVNAALKAARCRGRIGSRPEFLTKTPPEKGPRFAAIRRLTPGCHFDISSYVMLC
jgi:DNA invertase Pin-like site-specific DNA recombinase